MLPAPRPDFSTPLSPLGSIQNGTVATVPQLVTNFTVPD
jgi:hypothetical protein